MIDLDKAVTDTAGYEGYKAAPYLDTKGRWTVGEGTCLETNPISGHDWKYLLDNKMHHRSALRAPAPAGCCAANCRGPGGPRGPVSRSLRLSPIWFRLCYWRCRTSSAICTNSRLLTVLLHNAVSERPRLMLRTTAWYRETPERAETILKQLENVS